MKGRRRRGNILWLFAVVMVVAALFAAALFLHRKAKPLPDDLPPFAGVPYVEVNGNMPCFSSLDLMEPEFERYSPLDGLGRCGVAMANIGSNLMPIEDRGEIWSIRPSGWNNGYYEFIEGGYLYNRCHLIGYQLTGENANERNLITGTRYLNVEGMLPFENRVARYIRTTGNHVLYRVTPLYDGLDLVASAVQMEALSIEDGGAGICFNVYVYNVQPGVCIDYATGDHWPEEECA